MLHKNKVPANSLILTIIIALILAILCSSLILLSFYSRQHQLTTDIEQRLNRNLESATNLVLEGEVVMESTTDTIDLFDKQQDSVSIKVAPWGMFEVACITAFSNLFTKQNSFIGGSCLPAYMDGCLYLADHKRPLSLNGNTILTGDVYLSKGGIKPIYINQRGFSHSNLVNGNIKPSAEALPALSAPIIDNLYKQLRDSTGEEFPSGDSLVQTFYDSARVFHSKNVCQISDITLKGHVLIKADSLIEVEASAHLEDVILIAPVIRFKMGFTGTVQAVATDSLIAEAGCGFEYPSALVLLKKPDLKMQNVLRLEKGCRLKGLIIARCNNEDITRTRVDIKESTLIEGIVYVMGYCSLGGRVNGTVLSDYFIYQTQNIMYENCLVDVEVNRKKLSPYFISSPVFQQAAVKQIIKWVK